MAKFEQPRFNSKANSKQYEDNYDKIFRNKDSKNTRKLNEKVKEK